MVNVQENYYVVNGKRWFDRINGNTYNSVRVFCNGELIISTPMQYGYGDHYLQCAREELIRLNHFKSLREIQEFEWNNRNRFLVFVNDVNRKKDL